MSWNQYDKDMDTTASILSILSTSTMNMKDFVIYMRALWTKQEIK